MSDLECTSDDMWPTLLRDVLEYVTLLTNLKLEGSAPSVPTLTRKEIIEHDTTRKESRAAAIARAAAADGGDGGGDGGRGGSDAASGQGDEDEGSRGHPACRAAAKAAGGGEKEKVSLLWAALSPGTIAMVARGMKHSDYTNLCAH
jgi:hypothetical protein